MADVPKISPSDMVALARYYFPTAQIKEKPHNLECSSWDVTIQNAEIHLEFCWRPLSGFGVTDFTKPLTDDDNPFAPYGQWLGTLEAAETYLAEHVPNKR